MLPRSPLCRGHLNAEVRTEPLERLSVARAGAAPVSLGKPQLRCSGCAGARTTTTVSLLGWHDREAVYLHVEIVAYADVSPASLELAKHIDDIGIAIFGRTNDAVEMPRRGRRLAKCTGQGPRGAEKVKRFHWQRAW